MAAAIIRKKQFYFPEKNNVLVSYESKDNIALITIHRAEKHNALSQGVVDGLAKAWVRFADSDDRVAVLTGEGDKAFCVGADLDDFPDDVGSCMPNLAVPCDKPIIAAVSGHVIGAGASIAMYSDLIVASESARFVYPEAKIGVFQGVMGGFPKKMPYHVGLEWAITGDPMTAQRAYEIGFVNKVCAVGEQVSVAMELAQKIAGNAPMVVQSLKSLALKTLPRSPVDDYYPHKRQLEAIAKSQDNREGMTAFRERRAPKFTGK